MQNAGFTVKENDSGTYLALNVQAGHVCISDFYLFLLSYRIFQQYQKILGGIAMKILFLLFVQIYTFDRLGLFFLV